ncbi:MAG: SIMPL domain-containing protein [Rhodocyclaceae bacterium]|nr:SIMPL domain-containing protein [Rhodocyclaceae bacterium]
MKRAWFLPLLLIALPTFAAESAAKPIGTLVDFRVDVQRSVPNDLGRAMAFAEMTGTDPAAVAHKLKAVIADGLAAAKAQPGITVKSGGTHSWPIYGKSGRTIESWRMRSEILLESRDPAALSTAVGKLQGGTLAIGNINFTPAPETRRKAEDDATLEAIEAFKTKAERIAGSMKKPYRIRQMSVNGSSHFPQPHPMARATMMTAEAAPMPVEAGESNVTVNVSGQIELLD